MEHRHGTFPSTLSASRGRPPPAARAAPRPAVARAAGARGYPARPVRVRVGSPAGYGPDIVARLVGQSLSDRLGQQFVVENRPGAGSNIATELVARRDPA